MAARPERTTVSLSARAELGIISGFVASVGMGLAIIGVTALNLIRVPWFAVVGSIFGSSGPAYEISLNGLIWFLAIGIIGGLVLAFAFRQFTITEGLGLAGIGLIVTAIILMVDSVPQFSGTLFQMGLGSSLGLFAPLAICYMIWGILVGSIAKRYFK